MTDTVAAAQAQPVAPQPFAELGLKPDEYARICEILGRRPTSSELAMYSVMWSEHCSYKSSKVHLRQFGDKKPETDALLVGIGENAGVVDIGGGWAVTFKVESHNHPSYVEPYQGAATGVGGIVRDIMSMGARPVAVMDPLRFGAADHPDTRRVLPGVVAGVGGYGNCLGLPNIGGEVVFDPCYQGNPLVNALCVGVMRHEDIHLASARGVGNLVILYGARTGGDGIGGASILASETFTDGGPTKRPAVQVGDPFMEKLLIECTLEVLHAGLVEGIQDLGAAGISCATSELASNGDGGMHVVLERVPLRDHTLTPEEILMSESQERMAAVVRPDKVEGFLAICAKWDVEAAIIGEVNDSGRLTIEWHGEQIVDVPPRTVAHEGPVYDRPLARPEWLTPRQDDAPTPERLARPSTAAEIRETLLTLFASPNLAAKDWVTDQYDRYVMGNTVLAQPEDTGMIRDRRRDRPGRGPGHRLQRPVRRPGPVRGCPAGVRRGLPQRLGLRCCPAGDHQLPELRLARGPGRDVAVRPSGDRTGRCLPDDGDARSPAATSRSTTRPGTWPSTRRPSSGCSASSMTSPVARRWRGAPMATSSTCWAIRATSSAAPSGPMSCTATSAGCRRTWTSRRSASSARSSWRARATGCSPPRMTSRTAASPWRSSRWPCARTSGARCWVPDGLDPFVFLLSESATRAVVVVARSEELRFTEMCAARGFPATRIGVVDSGIGAESGVLDGGQALVVDGVHGETVVLPLGEVRELREATLPALFG